MKFLFLILILFAPMTWAQIESVKTIQKSLPVNNPEEAKTFLLYSGIIESVEESASDLGIDVNDFKSKLESRFNLHFEKIKSSRLAQKYGKAELTEEEKNNFFSSVEENREKEFILFSKLDQILDSHVFQSLEKDPEGPWKAVIALTINKEKIQKYYQRLQDSRPKQYLKLIIVPELDLVGVSWPEMGLERSTSFTEPLLDSWSKWMDGQVPSNVSEVVPCRNECLDNFDKWLQVPQEQGMLVEPDFQDSLWLKISFTVRRQNYDESINESRFEWDGSVVVLDANTKMIVSSFYLSTEVRTWRNLDQKGLNSALASSLYKSALDSLNRSVKKVQESVTFNRLNRLVIQGHHNMDDVLSLIELLKKEGASIGLVPQLNIMGQKEAELLCFYRGEEKSFIDLLSRLKELKSSHSYRLVNEFTGIHHVLKLIAE